MQEKSRPIRSRALLVIGVLIILGAAAAYVLTSTGGAGSSQISEISSLRSVVSSLSQQVSSQTRQTQSSQGSSVVTETQIATSTVTMTGASGTTTTVTVGGLGTVTSTVTRTTTTTATVSTTLGGPDFFTLSGTLTIPTGNGSGTLSISLMNDGYESITGINLVIPTGSSPASDLCSNSCSIALAYNGAVVSANYPLTGGATATGTTSTTEGMVGSTYTITANVSFADGTQQEQSLQLMATAN